ncbi:hypothetical protein BJ138DRAFT_1233765 [Hygrophoropsis aurantiaca]|uniref:Uncharacterized protein n=1 Tax=Hygrophoropsis aurantiaca TaxID=72124 RepID=A0ACB7ZUV2_9AGAM|nr:hypothetical protein BJ138DRAFT_1233765 [Hygrophoropsis aurantiaca]
MADPTQVLQNLQTENYVAAAAGAVVIYDQGRSYMGAHAQLSDNTIKQLIVKMQIVESKLELVDCLIPYRTSLWIRMHDHSHSDFIFAADLQSGTCISIGLTQVLDMYLAVKWGQTLFLQAMQAILVIHVYALLNRSKKVVVFLATFYCLQAIAAFVMAGLLTNERVLHGSFISISPAIGSIEQNDDSNSSTTTFKSLPGNITIIFVVFDTVLLSFALLAFVRHASEAKRLDGGWSINMLVRTLVADQLVYFVCYLVWMSINLATDYNSYQQTNVFTVLLNHVYNISRALAVVAGPRMVISLRTIENKTRQEGTIGGELSTIQFGVRELPAQSESVMEEGGGI